MNTKTVVYIYVFFSIFLFSQVVIDSVEYDEYNAIDRNYEISIKLYDSVFIYQKYQDITFYYVYCNYLLNESGDITFRIDSLKTRSIIDTLNKGKKRYIMPPDFLNNKFFLKLDTIVCEFYNNTKLVKTVNAIRIAN